MAKKKVVAKQKVIASKKDEVNPKKRELEIEIKKHEHQQEQLDNAAARQIKLHAQTIAKTEKSHKENLARIKAKKDARQDAVDAAKAELQSL